MKKKKSIVSLIVCLSLIFSMIMPSMLTKADTGSSSGMVINKMATANGDGTYTIQLEAYATGSKVITEVKEDIPTDIVLVLDQSGSMDDPIGKVSFIKYSNNQSTNRLHYSRRHNGGSGNLYYPLGDGSYASVSMIIKEVDTYTKINKQNNSYYYNNSNNIYAIVDGVYQKVTVNRRNNGGWLYPIYYYVYELPDGTQIGESTGQSQNPTFQNVDGNVLYLRSVDQNNTVYTYVYTDTSGELQTIGTSTGADTVFGTTLYQKVVNTSEGDSRLKALTTAVTNFKNNVAQKAAGDDNTLGTEDDVNHRIAVVGYASRADSNNPWINTEVFIGANQYNYNANASSYYGSAFQSMNTESGQKNIADSIGALDANGATYTNYGLEMANGILNANPVKEGEKRNRVIILFTDGYPGRNADDFNSTAANSAINEAKTAKDAGVSVYSVGIFAGADATSAGDKDGTNTEAANWFMQQVSSNNGTPQDPSYYLSAADADTLNNIFQQISDQIESGGSSTTLSGETVIKDIIAPQFSLPEGASTLDITLETYSCTGKNGDSYLWVKNEDAMGASATVSGDQVSVTGFNFADNYVGTETAANGTVTYRGSKLVISFTVSPKAGFLGGNNVYTNTSAGVYESSSATTPVLTFERPQVNVPINAVSVSPEDKNVYLLGEVTLDELKSDAAISVGNVSLDLSEENYGLEAWQNEYVDITITVKDAEGNEIDRLSNLSADQTYTVYATVSPKFNGDGASGTPETAQSENGVANINVFKPVLTYKDRDVYYGDSVPTDFSEQLSSTVWKHNDTTADTTEMGAAPTLDLTYLAEASKVTDDIINSKNDIGVNVTVKIGDADITGYTEFVHTDCADGSGCTWAETTLDGAPAFLLHPKTCELTITKTGGAADEPYVFTVKKDGTKYSEVTIVGNDSETIYELPVGTYTIEEDTGWSWRFDANNGAGVTLSSLNTSGTITCTNTQEKPYWLNGFSEVVENIFGIGKN